MSIEMDNPKTIKELVDAASNLVEQMNMAHRIKDEKHFNACHLKAGKFLFEAMQQIEESNID